MRRKSVAFLSGLLIAMSAHGFANTAVPNPFESLLDRDDAARQVAVPASPSVAGAEWLGASTPSASTSVELNIVGGLGYGLLAAEGSLQVGAAQLFGATAVDSATTGGTTPKPDDPAPT